MKKFIVFLMALLVCGSVYAATTPNSIITAQTPKNGLVQFLQGTDVAGTYKTLYTGSANGSKIMSIVATTNDPSATHLLTCQVVNGGVFYGGTAATIAVSTGFANAAYPLNIISTWTGLPVDSDGNPFLYLKSASDTLQCTFATAITATDVINIMATAADF